VTRAAIEAKNYDLKAVNPNRKVETDSRTPAEILAAIEQRHQEVSEALKTLRALIGS
jgi:type I restriction enzyme M protein